VILKSVDLQTSNSKATDSMKGPGLKLDLDVRRLWKCPSTGETIRLSGDVTSKTMQVDGETVFMQLVEEKRKLHQDPYHFDFTEADISDQSSSERAAAAARSLDAEPSAPEAETAVPESVSESPESAKEESSTENESPADEEENFGDGLL